MTDGDHPYMKQWWVPGLQIGYEHTFIHQVADFHDRSWFWFKPAAPTFRDGLMTEYVTDAVLKSAETRQWEKVEGFVGESLLLVMAVSSSAVLTGSSS